MLMLAAWKGKRRLIAVFSGLYRSYIGRALYAPINVMPHYPPIGQLMEIVWGGGLTEDSAPIVGEFDYL